MGKLVDILAWAVVAGFLLGLAKPAPKPVVVYVYLDPHPRDPTE